MLKIFLTTLSIFSLTVCNIVAAAENSANSVPVCIRLDEKASGDIMKYSLDADVDGQVFFSGIRCAIKHRNKEFCAMEMVNFDTSANVYDYYTAEKISIGKAFFWLEDNNEDGPVLAFTTKETAEKYRAEKRVGIIVDYDGLTSRILK